jgi:hypothetical protein
MVVKSRDDPSKKEKWFSGSKLKDNEFLIEECKQCCLTSDVKIVRYRNLLPPKDDLVNIIPHRDDLCVKCLKGDKCTEHSSTLSTQARKTNNKEHWFSSLVRGASSLF